MLSVTVSPAFEVVIPPQVREELHIQAGERMQVLCYDNRIELLPYRSPQEMRGFLRGIDTTVERDEDRL